jgi:metallo-beta-lactamase class B
MGQCGIRTLANPRTCVLARAHGMPIPDAIEGFPAAPAALDAAIQIGFQGAGHTSGNVVCWLPDQRVLFGGCLLKSITSQDLD